MNTWLKSTDTANQPLDAFQPGDLINYWTDATHTLYTGEIVDIDDGQLIVHYLQRTEYYGGKLWRFHEDDPEHHVGPANVVRHLQHRRDCPLSKRDVKHAWVEMGYVVGVEDYCLQADESAVTLDLGDADSESDDDGIDEEMDDFIVPDDEGEAFCPPDPALLTEEQRKWVNQTHAAVREWDGWAPTDTSETRVKAFVDNMAGRYGHKEDERRFASGTSSSALHNPTDI